MNKNNDFCEVAKCKRPGYLTWYGHTVCKKHWLKHCKETIKWTLFKAFGIDPMKGK